MKRAMLIIIITGLFLIPQTVSADPWKKRPKPPPVIKPTATITPVPSHTPRPTNIPTPTTEVVFLATPTLTPTSTPSSTPVLPTPEIVQYDPVVVKTPWFQIRWWWGTPLTYFLGIILGWA